LREKVFARWSENINQRRHFVKHRSPCGKPDDFIKRLFDHIRLLTRPVFGSFLPASLYARFSRDPEPLDEANGPACRKIVTANNFKYDVAVPGSNEQTSDCIRPDHVNRAACWRVANRFYGAARTA
jgi:hypothetical protein